MHDKGFKKKTYTIYSNGFLMVYVEFVMKYWKPAGFKRDILNKFLMNTVIISNTIYMLTLL